VIIKFLAFVSGTVMVCDSKFEIWYEAVLQK